MLTWEVVIPLNNQERKQFRRADVLHEKLKRYIWQVKMCGDEGEEKEGRDDQGCRGPGRICRLCGLVDLKEQSGHTQCCWKNVGTREMLMMQRGPLGVQGPQEGVRRSRPPVKRFGLCQVGQTPASDGEG